MKVTNYYFELGYTTAIEKVAGTTDRKHSRLENMDGMSSALGMAGLLAGGLGGYLSDPSGYSALPGALAGDALGTAAGLGMGAMAPTNKGNTTQNPTGTGMHLGASLGGSLGGLAGYALANGDYFIPGLLGGTLGGAALGGLLGNKFIKKEK